MAPIRVGFIGLSTTGWASAALVAPLFDPLLSSSYTLSALCTTSEATATAAAEKYTKLAGHIVKAYHGEKGPSAIANDPEVDLVAVSVKIPDHFQAVMPAIEAGKDIFIEWTVGNGYEETVKIAEAAKRKGVRVLVGAQGIQNPSLQKVKDLVDSGKIGRILSTTAILAAPVETHYWGRTVTPNTSYAFDINKGATILTIPVGHFLSVLTTVLGDFVEVSASGTIQLNSASFVDKDGKPTGETLKKTVHDQIALNGTLRSKDGLPGTFVNVHCRAGLPLTGEHGRGRTLFKWVIDGELGTIEVQNKTEQGPWGAFIALGDKRVLLNGAEVTWEAGETDRLDNPGKAWLEFAKGNAALTSLQEGRKIAL